MLALTSPCRPVRPLPWRPLGRGEALQHLSNEHMHHDLVVHPSEKPTSWRWCSLERTCQQSSCEALALSPVEPSGRSRLPLQPSQLSLLVLSNPSQHPARFVWLLSGAWEALMSPWHLPTTPAAAADHQPLLACHALKPSTSETTPTAAVGAQQPQSTSMAACFD